MGWESMFKPVPLQVMEKTMEQAQEATKPKLQEVSTNLDDYKGFDSSALRRSMEQNLKRRSAESRAQALASLGKMGVRGADTSRAISDIAGQEEEARGDLNARLGYQDYLTRVAERDFALRKQESDFARAMAEWQAKWSGMNKERESRDKMVGDLLGAGASLGGAYLGGK